jgi:hypothetical protein
MNRVKLVGTNVPDRAIDRDPVRPFKIVADRLDMALRE